jgi:tungstate transport system ATP-binding protein
VKAAPAYEIHSLVHTYDGKTVLEIPQLEIPAGQICALFGPNGSGKTTLLSILALLLRPRAGSVRLHGMDAMGGRDPYRLRRQVTLIHQKPILFKTTVWNNVSYGLRALGLPAQEIKTRAGAILEKLELSNLVQRQAHKLSGGEAQRVVLARGLVLETPILLLDEPTSFLDDSFLPLLFDLLMQANQSRGITILVTTHDLKFVSSLSHRNYCLDEGKIVLTETTKGIQ